MNTKPEDIKTITATRPSCGGCLFFSLEEEELGPNQGRCKRFPRQRLLMPVQNALGQTAIAESCNYPIQQSGDWCGEYTYPPVETSH